MNKIINILELDQTNSITLYELDNDIKKQEKILNLLPEIKNTLNVYCFINFAI